MNYLAHFYLSGNNDQILFGNFIGDAIKGKQWEAYSPDIQKGIFLHRFIDDFIDKHPFSQESRKRIRKDFGITSPVVLDVYFDHFLSRNWKDYHVIELLEFTEITFDRLRPRKSEMTGFYPMMVEKMESEAWILSYQTIEGTAKVLERMSKRVRFKNNWHLADQVLRENYQELESDFRGFFPEIISAVENTFDIKLFNS